MIRADIGAITIVYTGAAQFTGFLPPRGGESVRSAR